MGMRPSSKDAVGNIDKYIGTAYDNILFIKENIDQINEVAENLPLIDARINDIDERLSKVRILALAGL